MPSPYFALNLGGIKFSTYSEKSSAFSASSNKETIRYYVTNLFRAYDIAPDFHRETHVLRYSDPDVKKLYDEEKAKALGQIKAFYEIFKDRIKVDDLEAAAIVIHSAAESIAHTAKFIGAKVDEARLINEFTNMIYRYLATSE